MQRLRRQLVLERKGDALLVNGRLRAPYAVEGAVHRDNAASLRGRLYLR